jgi:hypothetical protein
MRRPLLIATDKVVERALKIVANDPRAKTEFDSFLERTNTIFGMDVLKYETSRRSSQAAVAPALTIPKHVRRKPAWSAELEATPLHFLPEVGAFAPVAAPPSRQASRSDGAQLEAIGFKPKGYKANDIAKAALSRMQALGAGWLLTRDDKYAHRGIKEMQALCALPHWGEEFLATAIIMQSLAVGYDWLHGRLSESERSAIRRALMEIGIRPALAAYDAAPPPNWVVVPSNWNIVCNASLIMTALAIGKDEPDPRIARLEQLAFKSIQAGMSLFASDGSWRLEGPGYWHLATEHLTYLLASLESADRTEPGLSDRPGIAETGLYRCYMSGPAAKLFNFGDSSEQRPGLWWMRWLGSRYGHAHYHEMAEDRTGASGAAPEVHPMDLLWRRIDPAKAAAGAGTRLPLSRVFSEAAVLRGRWGDPVAAYVGIKGGETSGRRSHSHLDLGHFVYEVGGQRWAIDLGPEDYSNCYLAPPQRYAFYRASTFGHNTLTMNGVDQIFAPAGGAEPAVAAVFGPLLETPQSTTISLDLSPAYPAAKSVVRTFSLERSGDLTIVDEITPRTMLSDVVWSMHTRAEVSCEGRHARLTARGGNGSGDVVLHAWLQGGDGAVFEAGPAGPVTPLVACGMQESRNPDVARLTVNLGRITVPTRLLVRLSPAVA